MKKEYILLSLLTILFISCEKEITVDLPKSKSSLVVEASINQQFLNLNYVYITRTLDYFNPDLSMNGVKNALVYITPGQINNMDTIWDESQRIQLYDISTIPIIDSFLIGISGIYYNPLLIPQAGIPYKLDIEADGEKVFGVTSIPNPVPIDTVYWKQIINDNDTGMVFTFEYTDPIEQNNYRLAVYNGSSPFLLGWGSASFYRTFDDALLNGIKRPYTFLSPFKYGDTLSIYLNSIGRKEYLFWESYVKAANNGGPFSTPVTVKSTLSGAIGTFTGYGTSYKRVILK
ncbi:MAG: DUF4249 domain-containing protein [Bacteroidia bacterium]|nr:DUF4249 domain-containing protein [Bacteroidia bacterium]MCC7534357.1 DUF4249 domain-containing protein [Bacteroidia bacterium]